MAPSANAAALAASMRDLGGLANQVPRAPTVLPGSWKGLVKPGNLDLSARPTVHNPDGSISTVKSVSFNFGGHEVLIPMVVGKKVVSPHEALAHFLSTGENLGTFTSPKAADSYAEALHQQQAQEYLRPR